MALHVIVDGYNLIRRSRQLNELDRQDILFGREALQDMLLAYKKAKRHRITVVFDGQNLVSDALQRAQPGVKGIRVVFSQKGRSADDVIKKMASQEREKALVVSSDNELADFCASRGATVIRSEDFEQTLYQSFYFSGDELASGKKGGTRKLGTKKKGPRRRLSKKARQHQRRIGKL